MCDTNENRIYFVDKLKHLKHALTDLSLALMLTDTVCHWASRSHHSTENTDESEDFICLRLEKVVILHLDSLYYFSSFRMTVLDSLLIIIFLKCKWNAN